MASGQIQYIYWATGLILTGFKCNGNCFQMVALGFLGVLLFVCLFCISQFFIHYFLVFCLLGYIIFRTLFYLYYQLISYTSFLFFFLDVALRYIYNTQLQLITMYLQILHNFTYKMSTLKQHTLISPLSIFCDNIGKDVTSTYVINLTSIVSFLLQQLNISHGYFL